MQDSSGPSPDRRASRVVAALCVLGLLVTGLLMAGAMRTDRSTEKRLLATQTRQAATVLAAAVTDIEQTLTMGLEVQASVLTERRAAVFIDRFGRYVGEEKPFALASLWRTDEVDLKPVATVGAAAGSKQTAQPAHSLVRRALTADSAVVRRVVAGKQTRIAYALADPETGVVIYAERAIPANRRAPVDRDSAFADLNYAIYFGRRTRTSDLTTTNVALGSLPLAGTTSKTSVPFGQTVLTLVTQPRHHLGSKLNKEMPWYLLVSGLLMTGIAAAVTRQVLAARNRAESDTRTIRTLYERVDTLFGEQRDLSIRLQRALLPKNIPHIPGLEVAAEYAAGAKGIDIGGDWYSVIGIEDDGFAFVVGDVSGHGVDAVAEMARARFTVRAYLLDGNSPQVALKKCSRQFDVDTDGHLVTVIAGVGNTRTGEITVANAGHPAPLIVHSDRRHEFVDTNVGPPLGAGAAKYEPTTFTLPSASTLLCFTDGLIERRGENLDVGLNRLATAANSSGSPPSANLELFISGLLDTMRDDEASDDIALLAVKRVPL